MYKSDKLSSHLLIIMFLMSFLISLIGVLLSVAFFTLMERKIMGLMHYRKGPNKPSFLGIMQPISDAMKLLTKEFNKLTFVKKMMYMTGPLMSLALMMACWQWFSFSYQVASKSSNPVMVIFGIMSLMVYPLVLSGWGSNSKYTLMGAYRAIAQVISYEVCLILYVLSMVYLTKSYSFKAMGLMQENYWFLMVNPMLFVTWMFLCMAESNRTPTDHAESESELVSGFNIEYGGTMFALIFIAEYGMILFLSFLTSVVFMGTQNMLIKTLIMSMVFVWTRCSFPRVRYDKLMMLSWKMCLPYSLSILCMCSLT